MRGMLFSAWNVELGEHDSMNTKLIFDSDTIAIDDRENAAVISRHKNKGENCFLCYSHMFYRLGTLDRITLLSTENELN